MWLIFLWRIEFIFMCFFMSFLGLIECRGSFKNFMIFEFCLNELFEVLIVCFKFFNFLLILFSFWSKVVVCFLSLFRWLSRNIEGLFRVLSCLDKLVICLLVLLRFLFRMILCFFKVLIMFLFLLDWMLSIFD